ncbi:MAG TPA: lipopolysaccharide biosynthesis protein [Acidimicrobiales bacterium]|nr:lipopolysaccharide biosynthesis protein [Acidimicrobiales bacterium]
MGRERAVSPRMLRPIADGMRSRFAADAGALTASGLVVAAIVIVQGVLLARWLGPRAYGAVALITAYPALVLALLSPESPHAAIRYLADRDAAGDVAGSLAVCRIAYLADLAVGAVTLLVVAATAGWAGEHVLHLDGAAGLLVLMALGLLVASPAHAATATLLFARRFRTIASEQVANAVVRSALMIGFVAAGQGEVGAIRGAAAGYVLHGVVLAALASVEERRRWGGSWLFDGDTRRLGPRRREMLRFLAWSDLGALLGTLTKQVDVLLLGWLAGPSEAGFYRLARSVSGLPGYLVGPLQSAASPRLAQVWAAGEPLAAALRRHVVLGAAFGSAGLAMLLVVPPIITGMAGAAFLPSVTMAQILLLGALCWLAGYWIRPAFMAIGEVRAWVGISVVVVAVSLALYGPAAAAWGGVGVAVVQAVVSGFGGQALATARLRRHLARHPSAMAPVGPG